MAMDRAVPLTQDVMKKFALGKVFSDNTARINSLDFSGNGEFLVTSSDDESIHLYSVDSATLKKTVLSKRYGACLARFTHHPNAILTASQCAFDDSIRYLSLHDNRYLRYFKGHRTRVVALEMSPVDDTFMSASLDNSIRLWDLRTNACQGQLRVAAKASIAYDPQGLVFAVTTDASQVKLYDQRSYDKGPFTTFPVAAADKPARAEWTGMRFSPDGKYILLTMDQARILLMDSYEGRIVQSYTSFTNSKQTALEATFSPDGQFVLSGSEDGSIHVWETVSGRSVSVMRGHPAPVRCLAFNPVRMTLASACTKLGLWLPSSLSPSLPTLPAAPGAAERKSLTAAASAAAAGGTASPRAAERTVAAMDTTAG